MKCGTGWRHLESWKEAPEEAWLAWDQCITRFKIAWEPELLVPSFMITQAMGMYRVKRNGTEVSRHSTLAAAQAAMNRDLFRADLIARHASCTGVMNAVIKHPCFQWCYQRQEDRYRWIHLATREVIR